MEFKEINIKYFIQFVIAKSIVCIDEAMVDAINSELSEASYVIAFTRPHKNGVLLVMPILKDKS